VAKSALILTRFLGRLRGATRPILAQTSDGQMAVVKFGGNPREPNLLFNEAMGSELYAAARLAVPGWTEVEVTEAFLASYRACWPQDGALQPGLAFASWYIQASGERVMQILPGSSLSRVEHGEDFWLAWLMDVCAQHADHRQALFVESCSRRLQVVFIDHGQMFGGPGGNREPRFQASRFLDPRLYPAPTAALKNQLLGRVAALDCDQLRRRAEQLPAEWKTVSAGLRFSECLDRLGKPSLLSNLLDTLFNDREKGQRLEVPGLGFPAQSEVQLQTGKPTAAGTRGMELGPVAFGSRCA
jgi:hypothetical protein